MHATESAGGIVRNTKGEIALVRHNGWFWGFPKGHIDEGETALEAAEREIKEEIGIEKLVLRQELTPYTRVKAGDEGASDPEIKTITMFVFDTESMDFVLTDPRHDAARWVSLDAVVDVLSNTKDKEFFLTVRDSLK